MTNLVAFATAGGKKIEVELLTERPSLSLISATEPCWDFVVRVDGTRQIDSSSSKIVDHPQHGEVLAWDDGRKMVKIPVERDEIDRLARAADAKYEAHRAHMRKVMGY